MEFYWYKCVFFHVKWKKNEFMLAKCAKMCFTPPRTRRRCSSVVEQRIRNAWVVSSNLTSGFLLEKRGYLKSLRSSVGRAADS